MIKFSISIINPRAKDSAKQFGWYKTGRLTARKSWEISIYRGSVYNLLSFEADFSLRGKDHAGLTLSIFLFGLDISAKIYDNRHWNYESGKWREEV